MPDFTLAYNNVDPAQEGLCETLTSTGNSYLAGIERTVTPDNWSGRVEVISGLDGRVTTQMVARYRKFEGRHLHPVSPRTFGPEIIALKAGAGLLHEQADHGHQAHRDPRPASSRLTPTCCVSCWPCVP